MSWNSLEIAKLAVAVSTPLTVLAVGWWIRQRELDRLMYRYRPFWSEDCWQRYSAFVDACFEPFAAGAGHSALLRLDAAHLRTMIGERFDPAWEKVISKTSTPTLRLRETYDAWVGQLAREIGVPPEAGPGGHT